MMKLFHIATKQLQMHLFDEFVFSTAIKAYIKLITKIY